MPRKCKHGTESVIREQCENVEVDSKMCELPLQNANGSNFKANAVNDSRRSADVVNLIIVFLIFVFVME